MKRIKRIISGVLVLIVLTALVGCTAKTPTTDEETKVLDGLLEIQPIYIGEAVKTTDHEFKKSDFTVYAIFEGNVSRQVDDYTFEVAGMAGGVYLIDFYYGGITNELYVKIDMNFYPTDRETVG